ncbi:ECF transporter S component [Streptococcus sp. HF-1907]|uniref:ECF transporter S component n=1 Tax=Streptococcus sp. HF-1907 TaxID=2785793 RepID=UPI00189FEB7B|nr:ECF transporter S component [Streptococcus sp. HF-1907]MBF7095211.1 ECF transporter S component [Streptococcus sp. HF-1907]
MTKRLTYAALFMALTIILSSFSIPVPGGHFYFNKVVIFLAALIFTPTEAMLIAGIGAFLGDFFFYPAPMFVSLIVQGLVAYTIGIIVRDARKASKGRVFTALLVGSVITVVGYGLGRAFIYATPAYAIMKLPFDILASIIGAVLAYILYYLSGLSKTFQQLMKK